jgi:hypothetical protein
MPRLYLCGAINGCTDAECKDWRARATAELSPHYTIIDPMRRDYRGREDENVAEIVAGDIHDIHMSEYLLVAADRPSWGTAMELWAAKQRTNRRIVVVCSAERVSPWLRYCATDLVRTLDEGIALLRSAQSTARVKVRA